MCALVTGVQTCALPIFGFMTRRLMGAAGVDWLPRPGSEPDPGRAAIAKRTVIAANMLRVAPVREEGGMKPGRTTMNESAIRQLDASMTADSNWRSEEHTSELQSLMRISYAVFCLKKKKNYR